MEVLWLWFWLESVESSSILHIVSYFCQGKRYEVVVVKTKKKSIYHNDCPYRIKRIGLCLVLLIFCQTKSDCQHRFTNHPVQLFFSDIESRDSISASALSETFYPVWTIIGFPTHRNIPNPCIQSLSSYLWHFYHLFNSGLCNDCPYRIKRFR